MKSLNGVIITFLFLSVGCVENPHVRPTDASLPPGLETYFKGYCHAADNLGIGAVQSDTYDYRFRQRLSMADDAELKRLYVIKHSVINNCLCYAMPQRRDSVVFGRDQARRQGLIAAMTSASRAKYWLWRQRRRISFQTRSMGLSSGL